MRRIKNAYNWLKVDFYDTAVKFQVKNVTLIISKLSFIITHTHAHKHTHTHTHTHDLNEFKKNFIKKHLPGLY